MYVLGFGTYDRSLHPRVGVLFEGLRAHGDRVLEVNRPLGFSTADRVAMLQSGASSWRLLARLLRRWIGLVRDARSTLRTEGRPDVVVVGYLGHFDVILARLLWRRSLVVLDQLVFAADTARDRGVSTGGKLLLLRLIDRLAVASADLVLVDTDESLALLPRRRRSSGVVVPVGAGAAWFAARSMQPPAVPTTPLRAIFFGLFTPLQGSLTIADALARLGDEASVEVTMVGTGQEYDEVRRRAEGNPRVTWRGWVEPAALPALVAEHDVCLGIFGTTPKGRRVVPNKAYQGIAAGLALLTSDTDPQRRALGDGALYVAPGDAAGLAAALRLLASDHDFLALCRDRSIRRSTDFLPSSVVRDFRERVTLHPRSRLVPARPEDQVG